MEINWLKFIKKQRKKLMLGIIIIGIIIMGILSLWPYDRIQPRLETTKTSDDFSLSKTKNLSNNESSKRTSKSETIFVDVKGAVRHPGVYQISKKQRIETLIAIAGGSLIEADLNQINLAKSLIDQEIVYVPRKGEKIPAQFVSSNTVNDVSTSTEASEDTKKQINLNTASKEDLQTLTGVGISKATAIIQYRETHGGFKTTDDLKQVDGIGEKTFVKLKPFITV